MVFLSEVWLTNLFLTSTGAAWAPEPNQGHIRCCGDGQQPPPGHGLYCCWSEGSVWGHRQPQPWWGWDMVQVQGDEELFSTCHVGQVAKCVVHCKHHIILDLRDHMHQFMIDYMFKLVISYLPDFYLVWGDADICHKIRRRPEGHQGRGRRPEPHDPETDIRNWLHQGTGMDKFLFCKLHMNPLLILLVIFFLFDSSFWLVIQQAWWSIK